ncbi:MAG: polysaccharide biosynthesis/export family protein [Terriglobales bacterium]
MRFLLAAISCLLFASIALPAQSATTLEPYRLSVGDTIEVRFYFNPELNDKMQIRPDGGVSLQLVGQVDLAGKTVAEAAKYIDHLYAKILSIPQVNIQVLSFAGQKVFVTGEVYKPGMFDLTGGLTLAEAIGEAGGVKHTGNRNALVIIRRGPNNMPLMEKVRLIQGGKLTSEAVTSLQPFDVVLVPESGIARVDRWVDQYVRQVSPANLVFGFQYLKNLSPQTTFAPF